MEQQELQLLIFSLDKNRYGIAIEQIAALTAYTASQPVITLSELLGSVSACHYSKLLFIKQQLQTPILVNEPDEVASISISDIRTLPEMLALPSGSKGVWGLVFQKHGTIILIDLYKNHLYQQLTTSINSSEMHAYKQEE